MTEWSDEGEVFALSALVAKTDGLCLATITHARAADEAWSLRTARTIFGPDAQAARER